MVDEFARLGKQHELFYYDLRISQNRARAPPPGAAPGAEDSAAELDAFFMFDPCQLPKTRALIEPYYQHWEGPVRGHRRRGPSVCAC
jgi:hypothetical protein